MQFGLTLYPIKIVLDANDKFILTGKEQVTLKLKDIMTKNVSVAEPDETVKEVARKMKEFNVGAIPVVNADRPVGIVTDRDIVLRNVSEDRSASASRVGEIMSSELVYGTPDMEVDDAAAIMARHQIRRLPVVEDEKLVGMVSIGDLATRDRFTDEAGEALSDISYPSSPQM